MSMQQVVQSRPSANGFGRRKGEKDSGTRLDNRLPSGKATHDSFTNPGPRIGNKAGGSESPSRDRLLYMTTCLIGHPVEVQVKNGSTYSGIFHATNADKDFGIILKMARLTKDASKLQKGVSDSVGKGLTKTMIISAKELVQVIAKDVAVTGNELINGLQSEKRQEIMIDSYISHSGFVDPERELGRWAPGEDDPQCPELENIFDGTWNRHWDQFETNAVLFGVQSTFDEELYTTKLERGPQMRDIEREALRIAKEIEGEETQDLHMAEERGLNFGEDFDVDEETRFSSVFRGISDSGYEENEDIVLDSQNSETFGGSSGLLDSRSFSDVARRKAHDWNHTPSTFSSQERFEPNTGRDLHRSGSSDYARQLDGETRTTTEPAEKKKLTETSEDSNLIGAQPSQDVRKVDSDKGGLSPSATSYAPSSSSKDQPQTDSPPCESSESPNSGKVPPPIRGRPGSSTSSTSERATPGPAASGPGLSPSSSMGSLASEKSTLNPFAKLNPNAKSFNPTQTTLRPSSPIPDTSSYYAPHMHAVPMGIGIGPSFGGPQPVVYNPQAGPQAYFHPNGPLYGQQMIVGHPPRQVVYMPNYPPEMQYKGRDY
ncbi:Polyadenylate-binding protein-interacting protein 3 [Ranunculus cassubicifolius]